MEVAENLGKLRLLAPQVRGKFTHHPHHLGIRHWDSWRLLCKIAPGPGGISIHRVAYPQISPRLFFLRTPLQPPVLHRGGSWEVVANVGNLRLPAPHAQEKLFSSLPRFLLCGGIDAIAGAAPSGFPQHPGGGFDLTRRRHTNKKYFSASFSAGRHCDRYFARRSRCGHR